MDIPQVLSVLRPGEDWGPCAQSDSDYAALARSWRGSSPVPTESEMLAAWATIAANAPALQAAKEKAEADAFATSGHPMARANRSMGRIVYAAIVEERQALNALLDLVASGQPITPAMVAPLKLKIRFWPQLLTATKMANAAEVDAER
jgi:hypothetical protein